MWWQIYIFYIIIFLTGDKTIPASMTATVYNIIFITVLTYQSTYINTVAENKKRLFSENIFVMEITKSIFQ